MPSELESVEKIVRDILQDAFNEGLVHLVDGDSDGCPPQEMSAGDLVGPANILEKWIAPLLAENDRLRSRLNNSTMPVPNMQEMCDMTADNVALRQQVAELEQQVAALRTDAKRYHSARLHVTKSRSVVPPANGLQDDFTIRLPFIFEHEGSMTERFDAAIDAARSQDST